MHNRNVVSNNFFGFFSVAERQEEKNKFSFMDGEGQWALGSRHILLCLVRRNKIEIKKLNSGPHSDGDINNLRVKSEKKKKLCKAKAPHASPTGSSRGRRNSVVPNRPRLIRQHLFYFSCSMAVWACVRVCACVGFWTDDEGRRVARSLSLNNGVDKGEIGKRIIAGVYVFTLSKDNGVSTASLLLLLYFFFLSCMDICGHVWNGY